MIFDRNRTCWLLVADGVNANVFSFHAHPLHLTQVPSESIDGLDTVVQDIESDTHGNAQRHRKEVFAHRVAGVLNSAMEKGLFQDLIMVAPPAALGDIRKSITPAVQAAVVLEITGEWTNLSQPQILAHLKPHLMPLTAARAGLRAAA